MLKLEEALILRVAVAHPHRVVELDTLDLVFGKIFADVAYLVEVLNLHFESLYVVHVLPPHFTESKPVENVLLLLMLASASVHFFHLHSDGALFCVFHEFGLGLEPHSLVHIRSEFVRVIVVRQIVLSCHIEVSAVVRGRLDASSSEPRP